MKCFAEKCLYLNTSPLSLYINKHLALPSLCDAPHKDGSGFSPRNLRRMREFYRTYESVPKVLAEVMAIGWTQNMVILEADLTLQEQVWYIRAIRRFGGSKLELQRKSRNMPVQK